MKICPITGQLLTNSTLEYRKNTFDWKTVVFTTVCGVNWKGPHAKGPKEISSMKKENKTSSSDPTLVIAIKQNFNLTAVLEQFCKLMKKSKGSEFCCGCFLIYIHRYIHKTSINVLLKPKPASASIFTKPHARPQHSCNVYLALISKNHRNFLLGLRTQFQLSSSKIIQYLAQLSVQHGSELQKLLPSGSPANNKMNGQAFQVQSSLAIHLREETTIGRTRK